MAHSGAPFRPNHTQPIDLPYTSFNLRETKRGSWPRAHFSSDFRVLSDVGYFPGISLADILPWLQLHVKKLSNPTPKLNPTSNSNHKFTSLARYLRVSGRSQEEVREEYPRGEMSRSNARLGVHCSVPERFEMAAAAQFIENFQWGCGCQCKLLA